ncbi:hypothetical protein [Pantoea sp. CCBC3-3-1]|uniref:hypothetical protein n=1 Tax=Pantoea sp. CCBC3-3-1 TaxID=2490851 RepID=UPI0011BD8C1C|nr:hypothetical protein [Pantoea sp. CCBC3-3-1]
MKTKEEKTTSLTFLNAEDSSAAQLLQQKALYGSVAMAHAHAEEHDAIRRHLEKLAFEMRISELERKLAESHSQQQIIDLKLEALRSEERIAVAVLSALTNSHLISGLLDSKTVKRKDKPAHSKLYNLAAKYLFNKKISSSSEDSQEIFQQAFNKTLEHKS